MKVCQERGRVAADVEYVIVQLHERSRILVKTAARRIDEDHIRTSLRLPHPARLRRLLFALSILGSSSL